MNDDEAPQPTGYLRATVAGGITAWLLGWAGAAYLGPCIQPAAKIVLFSVTVGCGAGVVGAGIGFVGGVAKSPLRAAIMGAFAGVYIVAMTDRSLAVADPRLDGLRAATLASIMCGLCGYVGALAARTAGEPDRAVRFYLHEMFIVFIPVALWFGLLNMIKQIHVVFVY
ncbi:MAG: hypothetical protein ABFC96_16980 [Thermoguttaceae bacterium]